MPNPLGRIPARDSSERDGGKLRIGLSRQAPSRRCDPGGRADDAGPYFAAAGSVGSHFLFRRSRVPSLDIAASAASMGAFSDEPFFRMNA